MRITLPHFPLSCFTIPHWNMIAPRLDMLGLLIVEFFTPLKLADRIIRLGALNAVFTPRHN